MTRIGAWFGVKISNAGDLSMSNHTSGAIPVVQAGGAAGLKERGEYLLFHCLVVSADADRQAMFARSATETGWEAVTADDAATAVAHVRRKFAQLAFVDLESDESGSFYELLERLAQEKGLLTVACGRPDDMEEEIWVRQVGAWLYLPGVNGETQLSVLCDEARRIVERLHVSAMSAANRQVSYRKAR